MPLDQIRTFLLEAKAFAKVALEYVPGTTPDEKALAVLAKVEPHFKEELAALGVSPFGVKLVSMLLELAVTAGIRECEAS